MMIYWIRCIKHLPRIKKNKILFQIPPKRGIFCFKQIFINILKVINFMMLNEEKLTQMIMEELTKSDVTSMINNKLDSNLSSKEFKKAVKEVAAEVVSEFCKLLWQRNSFWKSSLSR